MGVGMRYKYQDQEGEHTRTEEQIIAEYYDYWKTRMEQVGKADKISEENCIADWVVVNWAWEDRDTDSPDGVK